MANIRDIQTLCTRLAAFGVEPHPDVVKAVASHELIQNELRRERTLPGRLLDLDPDALRDRFTETTTRADDRAVSMAMTKMQNQLSSEATEVMIEHAPAIITALRPKFDAAAKVINAAAKAGIRPGMDAADVINLDDPAAIAAWRTLTEPAVTLQTIASIRIALSEMFGLAPAVTHGQQLIGERVDWTACFTEPAAKVTVGYGEGNPVHRWLSLSIATGGRLRLNDPEETATILFGDGESPGWIVCGGGALVYDDERRALQLYNGDWIPTWVPADQVDHLIDCAAIVAARPEAPRPADQYPLGSEEAPVRRASTVTA